MKRFLLHEYRHIQRFDWFVAMVIECLSIFFWFVPGWKRYLAKLAWLVELSCDDYVLSLSHKNSHDRTDYATDFLLLAKSQQPLLPMSTKHTLDASDAFRRIEYVLEPTKIIENDQVRVWVFSLVFICLLIPFSTLTLVQWPHLLSHFFDFWYASTDTNQSDTY